MQFSGRRICNDKHMSSQVVLKYVEKKQQAGSCDAAAKEKF